MFSPRVRQHSRVVAANRSSTTGQRASHASQSAFCWARDAAWRASPTGPEPPDASQRQARPAGPARRSRPSGSRQDSSPAVATLTPASSTANSTGASDRSPANSTDWASGRSYSAA